MPPPPLMNTIPCCLVMNTSALLGTQLDAVELLTQLLPKSPHVVVIPEDVLIELRGLTQVTAGSIESQAESVLKALQRYPDFSPHGQSASSNAPPTAPASSTPPKPGGSASRTRGVAVLQKPRETYYTLKKFARNRDTKIVACAFHFTVKDSNAGEEDEKSGSPTHSFDYESAFFVTNDVVQHIKASPYKIPTIDTVDLKRHWGHLGHWEA